MSTSYVFGSLGRTCTQALTIRTVSRKNAMNTKSSSPCDTEKSSINFMYNASNGEFTSKKLKD